MRFASKISAAFCVGLLLLGAAGRADALPIYGIRPVSGENRLLRFESTTPGTINLDIPITGLQATEVIQGIDFRPLTGQLYAVGQTGSVWRLYTINTTTGAATAVGQPGAFSLSASNNFGFDFDPTSGFIRAVNNADQNILINPNNGALSETHDTLAYAAGDPNAGQSPNVLGLAYLNNFHGATATTLYGIDETLDILVVQNPAAEGNLMTKGSLGVNTSFVIGFDIAAVSGSNTAYATLRVGAITGLYTINLNTGAATLIGAVGGNPILVDIAVSLEPQTFVVTDTTDPGNGANCSLREAINAANAKPGPDVIHFNIPGGGVKTILPTSLLPPLTDPVTINGYSQPGASTNTLAVGNNAVLRIQLDGESAGNVIAGLVIRASRCTVRGLVINRYLNDAIIIENPPSPAAMEATGNAIVGNFIGTDPGGTFALGNRRGLTISSFNNQVGGTAPSSRNVISGSTTGFGILVNMTGGQNVIQGNYIGTDKNGAVALPNDDGGISIHSAGNSIGSLQPGAGNLISGNGRNGIEISGTTFAVVNNIRGNLIGTDATGSATLGNENNGVLITNGASSNTVGGPTSAARNIISGNGDDGVRIASPDASDNRVLGNFIGTDAAGLADLGNKNGIAIAAPGNFVGGTAPGEGNVISGNTFIGVGVHDAIATGNRVQGNRIGTDVAGGPLGNQYGIYLLSSSSNTIVGGPPGAANTIAFNQFGVLLNSSAGTGNAITGNSIFSNSGLGIDLLGAGESFGATPNDSLDADTGPNRLQNFPVLTGFSGSGSTLAVQGLLNSAPTTGYNIHFYRNEAVDPSGFGEGQTPIGVLFVQTDGQGHTSFSFPLDSNATGQYITATATDPNGNTSEFSMASSVVPGPPAPTPTPTPTPTPGLVANVSTRLPVGTDDNVLIEGFIVQGTFSSSKKIIVRALGPFLTQFGIPNALANPTLEIKDSNNNTVAMNNDWKQTQFGGYITSDQVAEINQSGLAPTHDQESAVIVRLTPGSYTAVVRGLGNTTGTGVVDAYDLSPESEARLVNVATRGLIQPGDQLMIAGFITQQADVRAVVRAIGPSLSQFGINNALPDTTLQLRDVNGTIVRENDDWETDQKTELEATGLQPGDFREAALVQALPPGQYTAQVRGKPESTGIGVVEIYFLQ
jgi:CSLREA domain-containing protein